MSDADFETALKENRLFVYTERMPEAFCFTCDKQGVDKEVIVTKVPFKKKPNRDDDQLMNNIETWLVFGNKCWASIYKRIKK